MSVRRDYLLRMIEQMGAVLARLRELILGGAPGVQEQMRLAASRSGVDLDTANVLDSESLVSLLSPDGTPDPTRTWIIAELIALDGLDRERRGDEAAALVSYRKALRLYLAIDPRVIGGIPEAAGRVRELEQRITGLTDGSPSAA